MAIESFRQLILDAQAMMDPDFAGKLGRATEQEQDADTGFDLELQRKSCGRGRGERRLRDGI